MRGDKEEKELKQARTWMKTVFCSPAGLRAGIVLLLSCWFVVLPDRVESQTPAAGGSRQGALETNSIPPSQSLATIPFEMYFNEIYVQVRVNNSEPMWFVVDSGAGG
jgi:hypothetical protein